MPPKAITEFPGNTGTHTPQANTYLLSQLKRANYITTRLDLFTETPDVHATDLQRLVRFEGKTPPNRKILFRLRLLTYYPPVSNILPEFITLLEYKNVHVCRLAHYHIRQLVPIRDPALYRQLADALERELHSVSPARRACAAKTFAKVFHPSEVSSAGEVLTNAFNLIGGARVQPPIVQINETTKQVKEKSHERVIDRAKAVFAQQKIVRGIVYDPNTGNANTTAGSSSQKKSVAKKSSRNDDGSGGTIHATPTESRYVRSRAGKLIVVHATIAGLRRVNRRATGSARVDSYIFDSGLASVAQGAVRHAIALLEWRCSVAPTSVARYLHNRLPHRNPPESLSLKLEDLGAKVYFARILSALAEDPNLSAHIPDEAPKQAKRENDASKMTLQKALEGDNYRVKVTNLFKFIFNRDRINDMSATGNKKETALVKKSGKGLRLPTDDPMGVDFAEALINLVKNASIRVLVEALRGLSRRRWTTWFETPVPTSALHNAPELQHGNGQGADDDLWGDDGDATEGQDDDDDGEELGAYENDLLGEGDEKSPQDVKHEARQSETEPAVKEQKETWFTRLSARRKERRTARIGSETPYYLKKLENGMIPALEVVLRRVNAELLEDEPIRRFAAVDAIVVLSRARIYGRTASDHNLLRSAQANAQQIRLGSSSTQVITTEMLAGGHQVIGQDFQEAHHPFQALVRPLSEIVDEDPNPYVRGRAGIALLFVIASGAGGVETDPQSIGSYDETLERFPERSSSPTLLRYFRNYVSRPWMGSGIGLWLMSDLVDYLMYEVLDVAPDLSPSAIVMVEEWAVHHPTVGVCGRLGAVWEKTLSLGFGAAVGESLLRVIAMGPRQERIAAAATIFLRRRTLDVAILSVGSSAVPGTVVPEPLPRTVGVEMEKYFSALWHTALLGPSAECRSFAVESLGGAAVLAGDPFRVCVYERLVELVGMGGLGVRLVAERVLSYLDTLYACREQLSERRAQQGIRRNGKETGRAWLEFVWEMRCEAWAAARVALGVDPPPGWLPLGPGAASDVANAERVFLKVSSQVGETPVVNNNVMSGNDSGIAARGKVTEVTVAQSAVPGGQSSNERNRYGVSNMQYMSEEIRAIDSRRRGQTETNDDYHDEYEARFGGGAGHSGQGRSSREPLSSRQYHGVDGYDDRGDYDGAYDRNYDDVGPEIGWMRDRRRRGTGERDGYGAEEEGRRVWLHDEVGHRDQRGTERMERNVRSHQEEDDRLMAEALQAAENSADDRRGRGGGGGNQSRKNIRDKFKAEGGVIRNQLRGAKGMVDSTAERAQRLFQHVPGNKSKLTHKLMKSAARSAVLDSFGISGSSSSDSD